MVTRLEADVFFTDSFVDGAHHSGVVQAFLFGISRHVISKSGNILLWCLKFESRFVMNKDGFRSWNQTCNFEGSGFKQWLQGTIWFLT